MGKTSARVSFAQFASRLCFRFSCISHSTADMTAYRIAPFKTAQLITTKRGKAKPACDDFMYGFDRFDSGRMVRALQK